MDKNNLIEITKQLYHLTLLFPKKEPLRYKMRELADEILANSLRIMNQYEYTNRGNPSRKTDYNPPSALSQAGPSTGSLQILEDLEILDSFFAIVKEQNWVSSSKLLPVWEGYSKIKEYLEEINEEKPFYVSLPIRQEEKEETLVEKKKELNERQQKILEILKEKGKAQVGEFKEVFPGVTKRTLRRDFSHLLKQGIIKRIGERNNTYYQLASRT